MFLGKILRFSLTRYAILVLVSGSVLLKLIPMPLLSVS